MRIFPVPHVSAQPSPRTADSASKGVSSPRGLNPGGVPDPSLGHWLAGFADGEGCFVIKANGRYKSSYACMFVIGTRADDKPVLELVQSIVGHGTLYDVPLYESTTASRPGTNPQVRYAVQNKPGCLRLCEFFDRYPLRSKKAGDYAIWRQAVEHWTERNWLEMGELWDELLAHRKYDDSAYKDPARVAGAS